MSSNCRFLILDCIPCSTNSARKREGQGSELHRQDEGLGSCLAHRVADPAHDRVLRVTTSVQPNHQHEVLLVAVDIVVQFCRQLLQQNRPFRRNGNGLCDHARNVTIYASYCGKAITKCIQQFSHTLMGFLQQPPQR